MTSAELDRQMRRQTRLAEEAEARGDIRAADEHWGRADTYATRLMAIDDQWQQDQEDAAEQCTLRNPDNG